MASSITVNTDGKFASGNKLHRLGTGNLGNPYATGGIAVSANQVGLSVIEHLAVMPAGGYVFEWVKSTGKVKAYEEESVAAGGALVEVGAVDLSGTTFRWQAIGH